MIRVHRRNLVTVNWCVCMGDMTYGPPYLLWNKYLMGPLTLYGTGNKWSPQHVHMVHSHILMVPHTLYGIGFLWYCIIPLHVHMVPLTCTIFFQASFERGHCISWWSQAVCYYSPKAYDFVCKVLVFTEKSRIDTEIERWSKGWM